MNSTTEESFLTLIQQLRAVAALLDASSEPISPEDTGGIALVLEALADQARAALKTEIFPTATDFTR